MKLYDSKGQNQTGGDKSITAPTVLFI